MKKVLSIILCVLMLITSFFVTPAFAEEIRDEYNHYPQIYVCGIGSKKAYRIDDPEKKSLFYPVETDVLLGNIKNLPEYAAESIKKGDPRILYNCLISWAEDCIGDASLGTDGITNRENVTVDPLKLEYEGNGEYEFRYDSRLDPVDIAKDLHTYLGWVLEDSGKDKVEIVGSSYGSSIVVAYLNEYKEDRQYIDSVALCVPSTGGVDLVGELFTGNYTLDPDVVEEWLSVMLGDDDLALLFSVLNKSGVLDVLCKLILEPTLGGSVVAALKVIVRDIAGTCPSLWTFVQDEYFYDALEYTYGKDYKSPDHKYAKLIERITYYHENVMVRAEEIMHESVADGVKVNVLCKYGRPAVPLSEHGNFRSDGAVRLSVSSFGATCSMRNEYLPEDYQQAALRQYNFLSPDRCVDASTCALPFNTWIIKGVEHSQKPDDYWELIRTVIYEDLDVFSDERFPQFLELSAEDSNVLIPQKEVEPEEEPTLFEEMYKLMKRIAEILTEKIKELFVK